MSNTPRTDARLMVVTDKDTCKIKVLETIRAPFARTLEREVNALTAERDQLRAEVERLNALGSWAHTCTHHNDEQRAKAKGCPVCATAERDQLRADNVTFRAAQKACEACDEPTAFGVRQLRARAERAEADLATARERLRSEAMDDYAAIKDLQRDLATERARLDWLESPAGFDWQWNSAHSVIVRRATIDAAMQEDAK